MMSPISAMPARVTLRRRAPAPLTAAGGLSETDGLPDDTNGLSDDADTLYDDTDALSDDSDGAIEHITDTALSRQQCRIGRIRFNLTAQPQHRDIDRAVINFQAM